LTVKKQDHEKIQSALNKIKGFQKKSEAVKWFLEIPAWRLALEGIAAFAIAFVCGKGLGICFQILFGI
jgi:hypothetical protein